MAKNTFAAIDIGSYEMGMRIYEISGQGAVRQIDEVRRTLDLGTDTYNTGKISQRNVELVTDTLKEFRKVMDTYGVNAYKAYGTSAVREMVDREIVLSRWERDSGIRISVLSNSEQRFLNYKSLAQKSQDFTEAIRKPTAIVDIGGGSLQISLFDEERLVTTQNLRLGVLRLQEQIRRIDAPSFEIEDLIVELVGSQMAVFEKLYLKERQIRNIIVVDDHISRVVVRKELSSGEAAPGYITAEGYLRFIDRIHQYNRQAIAATLDIRESEIPLLYISAIMLRCILNTMHAEMLWVPGVSLCDGIVYEYVEKKGLARWEHSFEEDIIACAQDIRKRYKGSKVRSETIENIALKIFDATKKVHGLGKRERLLLRISAILHDCGKYISMANLSECCYGIIMSTEIIGLSHREREMVANIVRYNHREFDYDPTALKQSFDLDTYLTVAKLTAIIRVANGLDRSHKQKFKDPQVSLKDRELIISVGASENVTLERGLFRNRAEFFEEIMGIKPVIRQKKR